MCFVKLQDLEGKCEIIVFPDVFKKTAALLVADTLLYVKGKINAREDEAKIIATEIMPLQDVREKLTKVFTIDLLTAGLDQATLTSLKEVLMRHRGNIPVYLSFKEPSGKCTQLIVGQDFKVKVDDHLFAAVHDLFGDNCIKVTTS